MALWRSVEDLVGESQVAAVYTKNLQGVPEYEPWRQAGRVLKLMGKYAEADPLYLRAIEIGENTLGLDHPALATQLNNWAGLLESQGKFFEAEPLYRRATEIWETALGPEHPNV
ncbi:unnamed protein product, partial [Ectocarpus sp. 8 AP-2014]